MMSRAVRGKWAKENPEDADIQGFSLVLSRLVCGWQNSEMVEVAGVEPAMLDGWVLVLEWLYSVAL